MAAFLPAVRSDCIVDLSHNNAIASPETAFAAAARAGIALIFNKATQGAGFVDPTYAARAAAARKLEMMTGAYHFCDGSDPAAQADHFLAVVGDSTGVLLALDAEQNKSQVSVAEVVLVASRIYRRIGRWPGIYMGHAGPDGTGRGLPNSILASNCWLWLPEYGTNPICPPGWQQWTMWQHTDGQHGSDVAAVTGLGPVDRSCFAGTSDELRVWFASQTGAAAPILAPISTSPVPVPPKPVAPKPAVPKRPVDDGEAEAEELNRAQLG